MCRRSTAPSWGTSCQAVFGDTGTRLAIAGEMLSQGIVLAKAAPVRLAADERHAQAALAFAQQEAVRMRALASSGLVNARDLDDHPAGLPRPPASATVTPTTITIRPKPRRSLVVEICRATRSPTSAPTTAAAVNRVIRLKFN